MIVAIVMLVIVSIFIFALNNNNEKYRKRWGKDQYRILTNEYIEDGLVKSCVYSIEQKCKHFLFGEVWVSVKHFDCSWGDCHWETKYYNTLLQAEDALKRLRAGDKWSGHKETIIKTIP